MEGSGHGRSWGSRSLQNTKAFRSADVKTYGIPEAFGLALDMPTGRDTMVEVCENHQDGARLDTQGLNSIGLEQLARQLKSDGDGVFCEQYDCPFLVLRSGPSQGDEWIDLRTVEASISRVRDLGNPLQGIKAIPLQKSERNVFGSKITVGRARNNDVIIRAPKVSKLHCAFYPDGLGGYSIQDMGSLNGTVVNSERLKKKQRHKLCSGDLISFWRYVFEFVTRDDLIARLRGR